MNGLASAPLLVENIQVTQARGGTEMNSLVVVLVVVVMASVLAQQQVLGSHHSHTTKCLPPRTILYVYTQPIQKECVLLEHNGKAVNSATGDLSLPKMKYLDAEDKHLAISPFIKIAATISDLVSTEGLNRNEQMRWFDCICKGYKR